jgi:DNA-binding transcriptional LysR family regulator
MDEILVFARVVESGSFSAAARLLGMPKSTVSRKVAQLEDRIGARLLQRTTRKLGLTDAGRIYYQHALRIAGEVEEAERAVGRMQASPRGLLRVSAPLWLPLGPLVAVYLERYPDVQLDLYCSDRQVDLVEEGFDLALRAGPLADSTLVARSLGKIARVLVAAPHYCKLHGTPRTPSDLTRHACIAFGSRLWALHDGKRRVEVRVTPRLTVNDLDVARDAAKAAVGIAWIPAFVCAADLRAGKLRQVLPRWRSEEAPLHVVYPTARHLSPKVAAFIELLRDRLQL